MDNLLGKKSLFLKKRSFFFFVCVCQNFFFCIYVCALCVCAICLSGAYGSQKLTCGAELMNVCELLCVWFSARLTSAPTESTL